MLRKTLMLTVDQVNQSSTQMVVEDQLYPSSLHLACIMNERTQSEKETFGKVNFSERFPNQTNHYFTEDKVDSLMEIYINELKQPYELIVQCVERSRDKYLLEFNKFESLYEQIKFFTEEGVKERKERIKLKVLIN